MHFQASELMVCVCLTKSAQCSARGRYVSHLPAALVNPAGRLLSAKHHGHSRGGDTSQSDDLKMLTVWQDNHVLLMVNQRLQDAKEGTQTSEVGRGSSSE